MSKGPGPLTQAQLAEQMDMALDRKEKELVQQLKPRFESVYEEMMQGAKYWPEEPETIQELLAPLFSIIQDMTND